MRSILRYFDRTNHAPIPRVSPGFQGIEDRHRGRVCRHGGQSDYLKSRSLLPLINSRRRRCRRGRPTLGPDPPTDRIQKVQGSGCAIARPRARAERLFTRDGGSPPSDAPLPLHEVGIFQLIHAFQEVIKRVEAREDFYAKYLVSVSVCRTKIEKILERVSKRYPGPFVQNCLARSSRGLRSSLRSWRCSS